MSLWAQLKQDAQALGLCAAGSILAVAVIVAIVLLLLGCGTVAKVDDVATWAQEQKTTIEAKVAKVDARIAEAERKVSEARGDPWDLVRLGVETLLLAALGWALRKLGVRGAALKAVVPAIEEQPELKEVVAEHGGTAPAVRREIRAAKERAGVV